jgi:hypothetical protein
VYHPAICAFEQALLICTITMFLFYLYKVSDELWDDSAVRQMLACLLNSKGSDELLDVSAVMPMLAF